MGKKKSTEGDKKQPPQPPQRKSEVVRRFFRTLRLFAGAMYQKHLVLDLMKMQPLLNKAGGYSVPALFSLFLMTKLNEKEPKSSEEMGQLLENKTLWQELMGTETGRLCRFEALAKGLNQTLGLEGVRCFTASDIERLLGLKQRAVDKDALTQVLEQKQITEAAFGAAVCSRLLVCGREQRNRLADALQALGATPSLTEPLRNAKTADMEKNAVLKSAADAAKNKKRRVGEASAADPAPPPAKRTIRARAAAARAEEAEPEKDEPEGGGEAAAASAPLAPSPSLQPAASAATAPGGFSSVDAPGFGPLYSDDVISSCLRELDSLNDPALPLLPISTADLPALRSLLSAPSRGGSCSAAPAVPHAALSGQCLAPPFHDGGVGLPPLGQAFSDGSWDIMMHLMSASNHYQDGVDEVPMEAEEAVRAAIGLAGYEAVKAVAEHIDDSDGPVPLTEDLVGPFSTLGAFLR